jgi:hypothetical protein
MKKMSVAFTKQHMHLYFSCFAKWIPNNIRVAAWEIPVCGHKIPASFLINSSGIKYYFEKHNSQISEPVVVNKFIKKYKREGMEAAEFEKAANSISELLAQYEECNHLCQTQQYQVKDSFMGQNS